MRPVVGLVTAAGCLLATTSCESSSEAVPRPITVVLSPHPDDEIQAWGALDDDRQAGDVVTVFLTRGEQTAFCAPELPGLDRGAGERAPDPTPEGSFSESCRAARIDSTLRFLAAMHDVDPSFPAAEEGRGGTVGPLPSDTELCRDDVEPHCGSDAAVVDVHPASDGASVVFFDLGDRDLTRDEVSWAIDALVEHRDELGLPDDRPFGDLVGATYANTDAAGCGLYDHPDHVVVSDVLRTTEFEAFRSQLTPVCAGADPSAQSMPVAPEIFQAAFAVDGERRIGAHTVEYGWLLDPYWIGDFGPGQAELFHRDQWFVRAFD